MIITGINIKGINYLGAPTLGSIGDLKLWLEFRKAAETVVDGASDLRLSTWTDLRSDLLFRANTSAQRPFVLSNGFSCKISSENNVIIRPSITPDLSFLHDGTPNLFSFVLVYNNPSNLAAPNGITFSTGFISATNGQGFSFGIIPGQNRLALNKYGDASATPLQNHPTPIDSLPEDASNQLLVSAIYYGNGLSNNSKIWIGGTSYSETKSTDLTTTAAPTRATLTIRGLTDSRLKLITAYNLSGKSVAEIDLFYTSFISTLKLDPEYANVITP
jgi:hypothetical protein